MAVGKGNGKHDGHKEAAALAQKPLLLTVREAARLLRISRNLAYVLVAQGRLPHIRLGRRVLIPRRGLEMWLAQEMGLPLEPPAVASLPGQRC